MAHVLIVDDEADLADLVDFNLRQEGLQTSIAHTGAEALLMASRDPPDIVLLDLMMPDLSGTEVCRQLRADPRTQAVRIVMLTARGEELERVAGFEAGADDYVVKPFSPRELVLRLKAMLRRASVEISPGQEIALGPISVDTATHRAFVGGVEIELTALELKLLHHLLRHAGRVQTRERLLNEVWGLTGALETRTVDTHVMRLREKLGVARERLQTIRGVGYRLSDE